VVPAPEEVGERSEQGLDQTRLGCGRHGHGVSIRRRREVRHQSSPRRRWVCPAGRWSIELGSVQKPPEEHPMRMDDMIMVSTDDPSIDPLDMYKTPPPAKWLDQAPKIVRPDQGIDEWQSQGESTATPFGMAATVGWPREEWGFNPGSFSELRPG